MKMARRNKLININIDDIDYQRTSPNLFKSLVYALCGKHRLWTWERCRLVHMIIHNWCDGGLLVKQFHLMKNGYPHNWEKFLAKNIRMKGI